MGSLASLQGKEVEIRNTPTRFWLSSLLVNSRFNRMLKAPCTIQNAALFLSQILHENGAFQKHSSNWRNLKTLALRFCVAVGESFEKGVFQKRWRHANHVISLPDWVFLQHKSLKMAGDCWVFKFICRTECRRKTFGTLSEWDFLLNSGGSLKLLRNKNK